MTPMTPKEKAIELDKRYEDATMEASMVDTRLLATIAVDEILKAAFYATDEIYQFYLEVKQEIEAL